MNSCSLDNLGLQILFSPGNVFCQKEYFKTGWNADITESVTKHLTVWQEMTFQAIIISHMRTRNDKMQD